ncbi:MAG: response regulator [Selenomonadaceae bacterium]|nr:response regulator [Selenomonadaceae bacterium]
MKGSDRRNRIGDILKVACRQFALSLMIKTDGQKKFLLTVTAVLPIILIAVFAVIYFNLSHTVNRNPKVEVQPLNTFEKTIYVVTDKDYEPYSYIDENGKYQGLDVEMMNEIANRLHMNLDLTLIDWNDAKKSFLAGDDDIIMNIEAQLIMNDPNMVVTLPTTEKQYVVYGREKISSVAELYDRRVASLNVKLGLGLDDQITYVNSYRKIFEGIKNGKYDFAICPIQVGKAFLEQFELDDVFPSYAVQHVYGTLAMHPEAHQTRYEINQILIDMQKSGRLKELEDKWITNRYENITLFEMVIGRPWLLTLILLSITAVLLLIFYTYQQILQSKEQTEHTKQLQENLEIIKIQGEELRHQQAELIAAKERAEEGSKAKSQFLSNMSHDIRTPMNAIVGYITLAKDLYKICENCSLCKEKQCPDNIHERNYEFLKKIDASAQHLLALINDVLEMSRIESGKFELELDEMDFVNTLDEVHDMFATQMKGKNINFVLDTSEVRDKFVISDKNRFNRILLNLLSNAYKFTPEGGKVTVTAKQLSDSKEGFADYELHVKDSGIGMTPEFAAKVFEAFERERTSTVSKIQGTGLGMAITKSIVDLMNGTIKVVTAPNQGTEFVINITFKISDKVHDELAEENIDGAQSFDFTDKKILLVDDIEVNREIAKMLLEASGFIVDIAVDGSDAVDKVISSNGDYDVVLMDIQMPIMNGYEATKAIRALPDSKLAKIPIVAMTANAFSEDVKAATDAGMNAHVAKPIDMPNLLGTLSKILT